MQRIKLTLLALVLLAVINSGCVTVTKPDGTTQKVPDVALMRATAQEAALIGTTLYLQQHPDQRDSFVTARNAVAALVAAGNYDPNALTGALQNLPISQLKGQNGLLIVGAAVTLWDVYGKQLAALDKNQVGPTYVLPVLQGVLAGLNGALGP